MKKPLYQTILLVLLSASLFGQSQKSYSGPFQLENIVDQNAIAKYTYQDDPKTFERIKNGLFSLVFKGTGNYAFLGNATVNGIYKDNLKSGKWVIKIEYNNMKIGDLYVSGTCNLSCSYKQGLMDGSFTFTSLLTSRTRSYDYKLKQYIYSKPSLPETKKIVANFKDGVVVGSYNYNYSDQANKSAYSVSASLDTNSILIDKYVESGDGQERIIEYKNGFWIRIINKNLQTGKVEIKLNDNFTKEDAVYSDYLKAKITQPNLDAYNDFKIGVYNGAGDAAYDRLNETIGKNSDLFCFLSIGGDLTAENIKNNGLWAFMTRGTR
jgi:hypothetical protein